MPPVIYLFHGEDELSIAQAIHALEGKLGDPSAAALNAARLDGRTLTLDELRGEVSAIPFFGGRRLVIVHNPLAKIENNPGAQEKLLNLLGQVPDSTALVLVELRSLSDDGKKKKDHWLLKWAQSAGPRVLVRHYPALKGSAMENFIQQQAKAAGGQFSTQAARMLAPLVGDDTRLANQEINKLLAYVNYRRPVEPEDVDAVTAAKGQTDIFAMVDALGNQDGRRAMSTLKRLLDEQDVSSLFGMIVRQFRLLLLAREIVEGGDGKEEVIRLLGVHPYVAEKILSQGRHFSLLALEAIYRKLLDVDEKIKTGQMEGEVALEAFVASLSTSSV
jgi:DNA polymerase-3 subunit delta